MTSQKLFVNSLNVTFILLESQNPSKNVTSFLDKLKKGKSFWHSVFHFKRQQYSFWIVLRSISSTFYAHFFVQKQITQLSLVTFQLCNFLHKNFAQKMCSKRWWNWLLYDHIFLLYLFLNVLRIIFSDGIL